MARPVTSLSPLTQRLFEIADDGQWHDLDKVVLEIGKLVLPGRAYRRAERNRLNTARASEDGTKQERRIPRSEEYLIAVGRRLIARETVNSQRRVEKRVVDGVRQFRLRPTPEEGGRRVAGRKVAELESYGAGMGNLGDGHGPGEADR